MMIISGWFKIAMTTMLFATMVAVVYYYYRPKKKEECERDELPKYRMLDDDE